MGQADGKEVRLSFDMMRRGLDICLLKGGGRVMRRGYSTSYVI